MPDAISGLELSRRFYREAVRPILSDRFGDMAHSAALIGPGSEVLGYDDVISRDHHWGPRVLLLVTPEDLHHRSAIAQALAESLPATFLGFSTSFGPPDAIGVRLPQPAAPAGAVSHLVEVDSPHGWFQRHLGFDPCQDIPDESWLRCPQQRLLEATAGEVFHDGLGDLEPIRCRLTYFPHHIWLRLLADAWQAFDEEQPFVGRAGLRGDDLGSRIIAARQAQRLMELSLMMARRYIPYSKWLGAALREVTGAAGVGRSLEAALAAPAWEPRQNDLCRAASVAIELHNELRLTEAISPAPQRFHARPFQIVRAGEVAAALRRAGG